MDRNLLFAIIFSSIIVLVWFKWLSPTPQKNLQNAPPQHTATISQTTPSVIASSPTQQQAVQPAVPTYSYVLENENARIEITSNGGVQSWKVKETKNNVELVMDQSTALALYPAVVFDETPLEYVPNKSLTLVGKMNDIIVREQWMFEPNGMVALGVTLKNSTNKAFTISDMSIGIGPGLGTDEALSRDALTREMRAIIMDQGKIRKKAKPNMYPFEHGWIAVDNRYFLAALIDQSGMFKRVKREEGKVPQISYLTDITLQPNEEKTLAFKTYWGIKKYQTLKHAGIGLEKTIDLGLFGDVSKVFAVILHYFYRMTSNYGWAIVLLTTLIQIVIFPLTRKSTISMQAMKMLQPEVSNLRIKYKDDAQRLNAELMGLYKNKHVNPFGGCLPLLLQIPIFWALFTMLRTAVELRHAPFMFWMKDLSAPDTVARIAGFPLNILPLLMGVLMFVSSSLTTPANDPMQKKMMILMPIIFTFMFWNFPSGLVLYWFVSNIYTIGINLWLTKTHPHFKTQRVIDVK